MPVSIIWSDSSLGSQVDEIDHGNVANGAYTTAETIFLRHDGDNTITSCAFYFKQVVDGYGGGFSGPADYSEIKSWGDNDTANGHGGIQLNMDPGNTTGWHVTTWGLSEATKQTAIAFTMSNGIGDVIGNAVTLPTEMSVGMLVDGEIPTGVEASFLCRIKVPTDEDLAGTREIQQVLRYSFTS